MGKPTDFLPQLLADDVVYTSGAPAMTNAVARLARDAGAVCYTDPFVPHDREASRATLMGRIFGSRDSTRAEQDLQRVA